jgi:hypothetical protein
MEPELTRKNVRLGLLLFIMVLVLFAGSVVVAVIWDSVY